MNKINYDDKVGCSFSESSMTWTTGWNVSACLDWDALEYHLWFEPNDYYAEEYPEVYAETLEDCKRIGVVTSYDLDYINSVINKNKGDSEQYGFYEDKLLGICGM